MKRFFKLIWWLILSPFRIEKIHVRLFVFIYVLLWFDLIYELIYQTEGAGFWFW